MKLVTANIVEEFNTVERRIYDEYPYRWDKLLDKIKESRTLDTFRMFIREVYSFNSKIKLSSREIPGRVPSGMSLSHAALFIDRPIIWIRDFNAHDFILHLIRWGLIPKDELDKIFNSSEISELAKWGKIQSGDILRRYLNSKGIERAIETAFETYKRSRKKIGVIVAATGTPDRYRNHPEVVAFLRLVSTIQGGVPFGGIRNEFIAKKLAGDEYGEVFRRGLERFSGDYYAAFRYAKMFALSKISPFKKSVDVILDAVSNDSVALKEAYMTVYSSVYGSLLGVHPILGGKELHSDELSSLNFPTTSVKASTLGPAGVFMKKRIELPEIEVEDAIQYGKSIRSIYKRLYLSKKDDFLDFGEVLPEIESELREEVESIKAKIDAPGLASDSLSAISLAFQFFSHSNVGLFDLVTATLPALYTVFVYYRLLRTRKRISELFERLLAAPVSTSVHCLIVEPSLGRTQKTD